MNSATIMVSCLFLRIHTHEIGQIQYRHDVTAQADDAVHPARHVRRAGDLADLAHFLDLEHIDAKLLVAAQTEQQDLHFVGSRQIGAGIDLIQHSVLPCAQHVFCVSHLRTPH